MMTKSILTIVLCFFSFDCSAQDLTPIAETKAYKVSFGRDEVIVGDKKSASFVPQIKMYRWNKENCLTIRYSKGGFSAPVLLQDKVRATNGNEEVSFYKTDDENFKFILTLKKKPTTNVFTFYLDYLAGYF